LSCTGRFGAHSAPQYATLYLYPVLSSSLTLITGKSQ
jgi:hypothetical protein